MFHRKDAVLMAVAGLLATAGFAKAETTDLKNASLSLNPIVTADEAPASVNDTLLMSGLEKLGAAKPLNDVGLKIYGWIEGGYTYNHRNHNGPFDVDTTTTPPTVTRAPKILPGPFNHEYGNHMMLNQVVIRFEKSVASDKFDVGGLVELMYGSDAAKMHSTGLGFNGSDATDDNSPNDPLAVANWHPIWQFDIPQAFVDINLPVGNGLKVRVGKFVTLLGYETIDPRGNAFYSHSWLFSMVPYTQTGILASYTLNDQWSVTGGITRGWDITMEDNNGCSIDWLGQVAWTPSKQLAVYLNYCVGPENTGDSSHYRVTIDPCIVWQVTDQLKVGAEVLYVYDGGRQGDAFGSPGFTHAYGDTWGVALYAGYKINDYLTVNGRVEKAHFYLDNSASGSGTQNVYDATLGVTITPMPKDNILKNLSVRPEIRYDWSEDHVFPAGTGAFKDQLTFGADVIFSF